MRSRVTSVLASGLALLMVLVSIAAGVSKKSRPQEVSFYALPATVTTVDEIRNRIGATDSRGIEWYWYGDGSWKLRDVVILIMSDNSTEYIFDDSIISISNSEIVVSQ